MISWLPQYHDMGLIGGILSPLYYGFPVTFFSPLEFIKKPIHWLKAITHYQGTVTTAPTFGYDLVTLSVKPEELSLLNLSSLEAAVCGAETVRASVIERFLETFTCCDLRSDVFHPSYGLAENTLLVSSARGTSTSLIRNFSHWALQEGWGLPESKNQENEVLNAGTVVDDSTVKLVSCGTVINSPNLRIVNPDNCLPCPAGKVGEIWLNGSSVARGYFRNLEDSAKFFDARLADTGEGSWLRTGDLGFVLEGQLYVTGRRKNVIIIQGRNYYPQDLESLAETVPGIVSHGTAAFSISDSNQGEKAVLVAEFDKRSGKEPQITADLVYRTLVEDLELELDCVLLVKRNHIPRTTSGKIQHGACRQAFLEGELSESACRNQLTELSSINPKFSRLLENQSEFINISEKKVKANGFASNNGNSNVKNPEQEIDCKNSNNQHHSVNQKYNNLLTFEKLDKRSLRYRFHEENDISWDNINEQGIFLPDEHLHKFGIDTDALNKNPAAREIFDWCAALSTCISFDVFEMGIIYFFSTKEQEMGKTKSATYLIDEEEKHIRVFRRFTRHLETKHPELLSRARELCEETADLIVSLTNSSTKDDQILLQFLFIEICSI
ncbi:MAG: AMP-binding protein, partial [Cyanobacteria bacterium J06635_10]